MAPTDPLPTLAVQKRAPIAICTVGELFGGVERHVLGAINGLRSLGFPVELILFNDGELAHQVRAEGLEPLILPGGKLATIAASRTLVRFLRSKNIRVLHVHGYKATIVATIAGLLDRFRVVITEHGLPEESAGGRFYTLRNRLYYLVSQYCARIAKAEIGYVTNDVRQYYVNAHRGLVTHVIPNGVPDLECTNYPRPPEFSDRCVNMVIVGRLEPVKGHEVAIRAMAEIGSPHGAELHIIGAGPRESGLRSLARDSRCSNQIRFLGFRRNIFDYIAHCDILLMPSLHEGLPYTLLEAMAFGRAIVASAVGGLREVLHNEETALLVPPGSPIDLGTALRRLINSTDLRRELGENARTLQRARFSETHMAASYATIYERALQV